MLAGMDSAVDEDDEMSRGSAKHLAWRLELENNYDAVNAEFDNANAANDANDTLVVARTCRNSVQVYKFVWYRMRNDVRNSCRVKVATLRKVATFLEVLNIRVKICQLADIFFLST